MSLYSPFSETSDEVSDEDNHPEKLPWWERTLEEPRRGRGRRTADSDLDTPDDDPDGGPFVHNPDPEEVKKMSKLSDADVEKIFAKYHKGEAADERRKKQRKAERKQRAEARAQAKLAAAAAAEERAKMKARVEAKVAKPAEEKAKRATVGAAGAPK